MGRAALNRGYDITRRGVLWWSKCQTGKFRPFAAVFGAFSNPCHGSEPLPNSLPPHIDGVTFGFRRPNNSLWGVTSRENTRRGNLSHVRSSNWAIIWPLASCLPDFLLPRHPTKTNWQFSPASWTPLQTPTLRCQLRRDNTGCWNDSARDVLTPDRLGLDLDGYCLVGNRHVSLPGT